MALAYVFVPLDFKPQKEQWRIFKQGKDCGRIGLSASLQRGSRGGYPLILWISRSGESDLPPDGRDLLTRDSSGRQQHQQGSAGCCDVGSQPQGGQDALAEMPAGQRQGGQ